MRKIANILTNKKFTEDSSFYNVVSSVDALIKGVPTLVIGWSFTKSLFPDANIVNWEVGENTYFTFGNREKRSVYNERLKKFKEMAINQFIKSVDYRFFNVITTNNHEKAEFLGKIVNGESRKIVYSSDGDMVYIFIPNEDVVYGLLLSDVKYLGKDQDLFAKLISGGKNVEVIHMKPSEKANISMVNSFNNCKYIIPCLLTDNA